jgi:hypothetical protein
MGFSRWRGRRAESQKFVSSQDMDVYSRAQQNTGQGIVSETSVPIVRAWTPARRDSGSAAAPRLDVAQLIQQLFATFSPLEVLGGKQHLAAGHVHRRLV